MFYRSLRESFDEADPSCSLVYTYTYRGLNFLPTISLAFAWSSGTLTEAYQPVDGVGNICRVIRLDETSLVLPFNRSYGTLEGITLTDDRDLTPLLEVSHYWM